MKPAKDIAGRDSRLEAARICQSASGTNYFLHLLSKSDWCCRIQRHDEPCTAAGPVLDANVTAMQESNAADKRQSDATARLRGSQRNVTLDHTLGTPR